MLINEFIYPYVHAEIAVISMFTEFGTEMRVSIEILEACFNHPGLQAMSEYDPGDWLTNKAPVLNFSLLFGKIETSISAIHLVTLGPPVVVIGVHMEGYQTPWFWSGVQKKNDGSWTPGRVDNHHRREDASKWGVIAFALSLFEW
jgi:hypothetical protein